MTYTCDDCGFLFSRMMEVSKCPVCNSPHIRKATIEERRVAVGGARQAEPSGRADEQKFL